MDDLLEKRYLALINAYGAGDSGDLAGLKQSVLDFGHKNKLRPDAVLLLLVLYDQMISRPYSGRIYMPTAPNREYELPEVARKHAFATALDRSLEAISKELKKVQEHPISSHQLLIAINEAWPTLSEIYGWG